MSDAEYQPLEWTPLRAAIVPCAIDAWDMYATGLGHYVMSETERHQIRFALAAAGVSHSDLAWMTASCPSLLTAIRLYPARTSP